MVVRYGVIGAGNIARKFISACKRCANSEIVAVASRSLEKAETFAKEHGVPKFMGSYEELIKSPLIDAIYIATVNSTHAGIIEQAINAKKAVICEKPIVIEVETMKRLKKLANDNNVLLMEAMWTRFLPPVKKVCEWVETDKIGKITSIEVDFSFKVKVMNENNKLVSTELQGGAMHDVGVYCIEFATFFAKCNPKTIRSLATFYEPTGADINSTAVILFENGILARLSFGLNSTRNNDAMIYGENGYIYLKDFHNCQEATLFDVDKKEVEKFSLPEENGFIHEIEHFSDLYINGKIESDVMPLSESILTATIYEAIRDEWKKQ